MKKAGNNRVFWRRGEPLVWATGVAVALMLVLMAALLGVIAWNGLGVFWPRAIALATLKDGSRVMGELLRRESNPDNGQVSVQFKTANRELGADFRWLPEAEIDRIEYPADACAIERLENGDFFGYCRGVHLAGASAAEGTAIERLSAAWKQAAAKEAKEVGPLSTQIAGLSAELARLDRLAQKDRYRKANRIEAKAAPEEIAAIDERLKEIAARAEEVSGELGRITARRNAAVAELRRDVAIVETADGSQREIPLADIVRFWEPNRMGVAAKIGHYCAKVYEIFTAAPRESNTEGGLAPAIFGTVLMVFMMAILCFPLGLLAGIYLGEYAKDTLLVRTVRIAVNNLAGIPSIVYGIFGLGFFVYGVGGMIDDWFFPEAAQATFGTGGILWASLTLGLLTVPVVIVATEESLRVIPRGLREGSLALGATKFQTLYRVLLPGASPGIMTGFILAMARAAGEVAPLMLTGVVKLAPAMPLDGTFPYLHLDRKFMHLGFHIYDVGFQSPNVEASKPMVYVTTLLLLLIILSMTGAAMALRNRMRKRYQLSAL